MGSESDVAWIVFGEFSYQFLSKITQSVDARSPAFYFLAETLEISSRNYQIQYHSTGLRILLKGKCVLISSRKYTHAEIQAANS